MSARLFTTRDFCGLGMGSVAYDFFLFLQPLSPHIPTSANLAQTSRASPGSHPSRRPLVVQLGTVTQHVARYQEPNSQQSDEDDWFRPPKPERRMANGERRTRQSPNRRRGRRARARGQSAQHRHLFLAKRPNGYPVEPPHRFCQPGNQDPYLDPPVKRGREKVGTTRVQGGLVLSMPPFSGPVPRRKLPDATGV